MIYVDAVWTPVIDGECVTDDPDVLLESGRVNQKDVMVGVNKDEGTMFIGMSSCTVVVSCSKNECIYKTLLRSFTVYPPIVLVS